MTPTRLVSTALVVTPKAERYAKQLVSHLGHKLAFRTAGRTSTATIGEGTAQVTVAEDGRSLTLLALGSAAAALTTVEHVLGSHLERFAQRDELVVAWTRSRTSG